MTSSRPYLLRAIYDWIVDNAMTPYLLVNAEHPGCEVPLQYVENGRIVFNINPAATNSLHFGNDFVLFDARFGGVPFSVSVPVMAVEAIYARENGRGMVFNEEGDEPPPPESGGESESSKPAVTGRPSLRVVK